jgi:hypothetical protein
MWHVSSVDLQSLNIGHEESVCRYKRGFGSLSGCDSRGSKYSSQLSRSYGLKQYQTNIRT